MGSQDQHRESGPQTAADALERAAALRQQADAEDRDAGQYVSHQTREEITRLKHQALALRRQEQKQNAKQDAVRIGAHRKVFTGQRTAGADVPDLDDLLGGGGAA